ncbi:type II toxin-antitoxin system RelE/ParE family toxin [Shinella curvata]|uniref:Type II toxin-antitoxin system RelE/ParE family toxin n=1 Tax=Shinella curvata TaxID=1817964 RepID=A0ABT8XJ50_9HYPH|nr:type II toxin-antitoxin system RelE/ParE family toxin [Shinella curvata]MCJ8052685.1 type II toxin-antitoxin system RelE/ParE family toxin [Shinella curvata]MDO6123765.1 type II toxin-antitoxin system RelE/ParE family toxin [Shinella curvata]
MAWEIEITEGAKKELDKLGHVEAKRIRNFLVSKLAPSENPRLLGSALQGARLGSYWRYRIGDYRIICDIQDNRLVVVVVRVGHRREIYS